MSAQNALLSNILEAVPMPAFIALPDGSIAFANQLMRNASGQPDLVEMDRTLFGLGVFRNGAELRGFLQSFKYGGNTRRLVLPVVKLKQVGQPIILYASKIEWEGKEALCGIITRKKLSADGSSEESTNYQTDAYLDNLPLYTLRITGTGEVSHTNSALRLELGYKETDYLPELAQIDAENDSVGLHRQISHALSRGYAEYETMLQRANGTLMPAQVTMAPLRCVNYSGQLVLTVTDLTSRRAEQRERQTLEIENEKLLTQLERRSVLINEKWNSQGGGSIVTGSNAYKKVLQQVTQVAVTDSTVLITGETGTGKELIARSIHAQSKRADRPLVILNCGALPADLIESELFGYRKGAFTGARADHLGRFELADEGTLFLDEIGEMPMLLQTRLLRVLQDGEFTPLGAKESVHTDVRIIAATNRNLRERVLQGTFRSDLYFRLNVFPIHSIPLRERPDDIPALVAHFIRKYHRSGGPAPHLRPQDLEQLKQYNFDGNIRELENIIQRALIVSPGETLEIELDGHAAPLMDSATSNTGNPNSSKPSVLNFAEMQRQHILSVLEMTDGKVSGTGGAAELLGLNPQTLFSKMRKLNIDRRRDH